MLIKKHTPFSKMSESRNISLSQVISELSFLIILLKFSIREFRNEKKVDLFLVSHFIFIFNNFIKPDFGMARMSTVRVRFTHCEI